MKRIAILDVETNERGFVFDIGLIIAEKTGKIVFEYQWILENHFFAPLFFENLREIYLQRLNEGKYPCKMVNVAEAFAEITENLQKFNVKEVYAYNAGFDAGKIAKMAQLHDEKNPLENLTIECLWAWTCQTIFQQKTFQKFCENNEFTTKTGNFKTNAEVAYAYITRNPIFEEEHTGLEDAYIELEIFLHCNKQKQFRLRGIIGNPWILAQTNEQIEKLPKRFRTMEVNMREQIEKGYQLLKKLDKPLKIKIAQGFPVFTIKRAGAFYMQLCLFSKILLKRG